MSKLKSKLRPSKNVCKSVTKTAERKAKLRTSTKVQNEPYQRRQLFPMRFYHSLLGVVGMNKRNLDQSIDQNEETILPANDVNNSTSTSSTSNKPFKFFKLLGTCASRFIKSLMIEYPNCMEKWFSQRIEQQLISYWLGSSIKTEEKIRNLEKRIEVLEKQILQGVHHQNITVSNHALSQAFPIPPSMPPPPPPPPPPPMAPPPPPPMFGNAPKRQRIILSNKSKENHLKKENDTNQSTVGPITLDVLKQVKLKKADLSSRPMSLSANNLETKGKSFMPLIDLGQLRSIKLKKTSTPFKKSSSKTGSYLHCLGGRKASELDENQPQSSTPSPKLDFRNHLKNTGVAKSPGGTPFCRKQQDCGEGFTPLLSRALKQKFQNAIPCESFSPESLPMLIR